MTGGEVRAIRDRLRLSQSEFAALVGVTPNSVARWERGEMAVRESAARLMQLLAVQARPSRPRERAAGEALSVRRRTRHADAVERRGCSEKGTARRVTPRRALLPGRTPRAADLQVGGDRRVDRARGVRTRDRGASHGAARRRGDRD
ncbi:MAG: helix-turn-helix domain-containing protein [Deltaproteobacteria bacterium]|nr:helix-turn-helix domain-containing protein [Deltaproteobacteria bacterium]